MTNQNPIGQNKNYDLEERTANFGEAIIEFSKKVPQSPITISLISQLVRAATSIGANYCEADNAESKMDFKHKISLCKKEAKETKYWLRIIAMAVPELKIKARSLWQKQKN
ncbi:MAG TPA: four helix bundle protein [Patescibacteria group bacterium]|nr:four helix bundle protein [Patescibacteria group bacterium]